MNGEEKKKIIKMVQSLRDREKRPNLIFGNQQSSTYVSGTAKLPEKKITYSNKEFTLDEAIEERDEFDRLADELYKESETTYQAVQEDLRNASYDEMSNRLSISRNTRKYLASMRYREQANNLHYLITGEWRD